MYLLTGSLREEAESNLLCCTPLAQRDDIVTRDVRERRDEKFIVEEPLRFIIQTGSPFRRTMAGREKSRHSRGSSFLAALFGFIHFTTLLSTVHRLRFLPLRKSKVRRQIHGRSGVYVNPVEITSS